MYFMFYFDCKYHICKNKYININLLSEPLLSVKMPENHQNVPAIEKQQTHFKTN